MRRLLARLGLVLGALCVALAVASSRGLSSGDAVARRTALSDGFFVPGLLLTGFGLLLAIARTGFFDVFAYAGRSLLVLFTPFRKPQEHPDYLTYRLERRARRGRPVCWPLAVGVGFLLVSAVLAFL